MGRFVLVLVSFFILQFSLTVHAKIDEISGNQSCIDTSGSYGEVSSYEQNLGKVVDSLRSQSKKGNYIIDHQGDGSDIVYGLFQCRIDMSPELCSKCVTLAADKIIGGCPLIREAILWYVTCMVRYSHNYIFARLETTTPVFSRHSGMKLENQIEFGPILNSTMTELIEKASSTNPPFSYNTTIWAVNKDLHSFAECIADIKGVECRACLVKAVKELSDCCNGFDEAMVYLPSCQVRYDTTRPGHFIEISSLPPTFPLPPPPPQPPPPPPPPPSGSPGKEMNPKMIGAIAAGGLVVLVVVLVLVLWLCVCRKKPRTGPPAPPEDDTIGDTKFVQYDFMTLKTSTRDFTAETSIGEGGFGIVYKGTLEGGEQFAIKRLSKRTSEQGTIQVMAEAKLLAKLRHNNLLKLVGCCLEGDEKLLVYEFMANGSSDTFLFDPIPEKRDLLDWRIRFKIIKDIARGLQYLHEDSPLTIVHRDLKPDNILLDSEMNAKIADFGLAKLFDDGEGKFGRTKNICGTIGYVAPEYMMKGEYSDKSDVYSFGVMLLEILSGHNNVKFYELVQKMDLPVHAWQLWNTKRSIEIKDPTLVNNCSSEEVIRCVQIGLLCLQASPSERPTMASVAAMLTSPIDLPLPSTPAMSFPHIMPDQDYLPLMPSSTPGMSSSSFPAKSGMSVLCSTSGDQSDIDQFFSDDSVTVRSQDLNQTSR